MRTFTISLATLLAIGAHAQWPTDPNAPLVVCDDASSQTDLRLVADGVGGWYVLWRDNRLANDRYAVFGQRLDAQGNLLWEPEGRLIQEVPGRSINMIGATRMSDDKLFLAYISGAGTSGADTVRAMAYDSEAVAAWPQPTLLAYPGPLPGGGTSGGNYYPRVVPVLNGVFVGWGTNPIGASDYVHIARILNDGTNVMPEQGVEVASLNNSIVTGPWTMRHDLAGGLLLEERWGNGAGAPLRAMRVDSMGVAQWPALLEVSANSPGLGYEWSTAVAPNARVNSVWGYGYDLRMAIYDTTGVLFNTAASIPVCLQADVQENPFVVQSATGTTVFWADNRSSAGTGRQVFMQRFDATGTPLLATDGVLAMQCDGNLNGYPRAIAAEDSTHIVALFTSANLQGGTSGFRVGRVTGSGTNLWSDTTRFCTPALGPNGGTDFAMTSDGDGGVMAVWFNWNNDAIYAARLDRNGRMGDFTGIDERGGASIVTAFPNPAADHITFALPAGERILGIDLMDAHGSISASPAMERTMATNALAPGLYTARIRTATGTFTARFIKDQLP
ncbi:MAG TPA: T9SS type A sorting domain-containing protein [Flavobacteriales bacterium]|nr:T9SS type A sorting domain-containing protein [Flavobacteriales bacterium]HMR28438.1 T9SS type A sorting domain-containing protein [Flavobacteriales bacterium]